MWHPFKMPLWFLVLSVVIWVFFTPELARAKEFQFDWILEIWLRDMALMLMVAGGSHLYLHKFKLQGTTLKYEKKELETHSSRFHFNNQTWDNMFWTLTTGVACWVFWESLMLWCFANGYLSILSLQSNPIWFVILLGAIPFWSYVYFDIQHRILHAPFLYKHIHAWHHKNKTLGPWSGLAMHPVEQFILMSDTLIFFLISCHPVHVIFNLMFHGMGAPLSHTGFDKIHVNKKIQLQVGDFYHQLHHRFVDINYGTLDTPFDLWRMTLHDGTSASTTQMRIKRKNREP